LTKPVAIFDDHNLGGPDQKYRLYYRH